MLAVGHDHRVEHIDGVGIACHVVLGGHDLGAGAAEELAEASCCSAAIAGSGSASHPSPRHRARSAGTGARTSTRRSGATSVCPPKVGRWSRHDVLLGPVEIEEETRRRIESAGVDVSVFDGFEIAHKGEGGPTCLTRPLLRG